MKTDLYTKVVLTVIALVLTINLLRDVNVVTPAQAAPVASTHELQKTNYRDVMDVNIVQINGSSVSSSSGGILDVNLEKVDGSSVGYRGIPVEVKNP